VTGQVLDSIDITAIESEKTETSVLAPWVENPYALISWWDMEQFSGYAIYWSGYILELLITDTIMKSGPGVEPLPLAAFHQPIDNVTKQKAIASLKNVEAEFRKIGLQITADTVDEVLDELEETHDLWWLRERIRGIQKLTRKEMAGRCFMYIAPERAKFWPKLKSPNLFGDAVAKVFPSIVYDVNQAGISLAVGLSTACVFHLMRILEVTLGVLGNKFSVSLAHTNWAPAIEQIESKIREMHKDPAWKSLPDCKQQQEFYAQAASQFGLLKDAWRNYTMHSRGKYTEGEAEQIFMNVKSFVCKLAEKLAE
jgi:hypothetical protein